MSRHISDGKWSSVLKAMDRREFIQASLAAGAPTLAPRFVGADAGAP